MPPHKSTQKPLYTKEGKVRTLEVSVIYLANKKPAESGIVGIYNSNGKLIKEQYIKKGENTIFMLPEGIYTIKVRGGNTGEKTIDLNSNKTVVIKAIAIVN